MTTTGYPVIAGHNLASNPFPSTFVFASTPPKPAMDKDVNEVVIPNVAKCFAANRADVAYALIYSYQPCGGASHAALVACLHNPGPWTADDGKALQQFDGQHSGAAIKDFAEVSKSLGLANVGGSLPKK